LGWKDFEAFLKKYDLNNKHNQKQFRKIKEKNYKKRSLRSLINEKNEEFVTEEAIDLLERMFKYDPIERITAKEAL